MLGFVLLLAYPLTVHFAPTEAGIALLAAVGAYVAGGLCIRHPIRWLLPPATAAIFWQALPNADWLLYLPPIGINLALGWVFGRTLVRGRVPLVARFATVEQGELSTELKTYTRTLTWLWTLLFVAAALLSFALAMSGHRDAWSLFTNFINYLLVGALFLGEFVYRRLRFRNYRHHSPLQLLRNVRGTNLFER
jgi:uncharacterized membrane protein